MWEQQRGQVLAAAAAIFGRHGAAGATMADVARHAGVAVGTLYKFFPSKQALHLALLEERAAAVLTCTQPPAPEVAAQAPARSALEDAPPAGLPPAGLPPAGGLQKRSGAEELLAQDAWASWLDKEPQRRDRRAQAQRGEILAAASSLFQERGFGGAAMADIAAAAGVATGTLYNFFPSKEALFFTLVEQMTDAFFAFLHAEVDAVAAPAGKIARLVQAECAFFEANRAFVRIYISARSGFEWTVRQELGEAFGQKYAAYLRWVAGILAEGMAEGVLRRTDPTEMALALVGMLSTTLLEWTVSAPGGAPGGGEPGQLAARAGRLIELFFDGARLQPGPSA